MYINVYSNLAFMIVEAVTKSRQYLLYWSMLQILVIPAARKPLRTTSGFDYIYE